MNWRLNSRILSNLLFFHAILLGICAMAGVYYREQYVVFLWPLLLDLVLSVGLWSAGRGAGKNMGRKDGYIIVSLVWVIYTLTGMLPLLLSGSTSDVASAIFETMSGFTSTGATVIDNVDALPYSILFWRSLMQWIGGVGIIFFTIALLPAFGIGEVKLFAAESTGLLHERIHPRISITARWIGGVYLGLTLICAFSYSLCGMSTFDAINYALSTTSTGGFSTHTALIREVYHSPLLEYVMTFFIIVSGINYTLIYFFLIKRHVRQLFRNPECATYFRILGICTLICTVAHFFKSVNWVVESPSALFAQLEETFRDSIFTVASLQTTTGFATTDYTLWPHLLMPLLTFVMFAGACSGSSSGGFKCIRWCIVVNVVCNEIKRILHPRAVLPLRIGQTVLPQSVVTSTFAFTATFAALVFGGAFLLTVCGIESEGVPYTFTYNDAFSVALSSLSNVGPCMGWFGPQHSWAILPPLSKIFCSLLMLIGRLEIFPILLLFTRNFWKKS